MTDKQMNKTIVLLIIICMGAFASCSGVKIIPRDKKGKDLVALLTDDNSYIIHHTLEPREFEGCNNRNLERVRIENNDIIPSWCFSKIPTLTDVTLSNRISVVEENAFYACKNLKQINLDKVTHCGESAFKMTSLDAVDLKNCKYVDDFAFSNCTKLNTVTFSDLIKKIGDFSFYADSSLVTIEIPNGEIGNSCFMGCANLKKVTLDKVTHLGDAAFMSCSALDEIRLSPGIKIIKPMTFQDCTSLNSIVIPEGIECISENAFQGTGLVEIIIPSSVKEIKSQAFTNCKSLKIAYLCNKNTVVNSDTFDKNVIIKYK